MKTSSKSNYAFKAMLHLALNSGGGVVALGEVAAAERIPIKFLEQVVLALKAKGLVESKRGANGGYRLAKDSSHISVRDILEATEDTLLAPPRGEEQESPITGAMGERWEELNASVDSKLKAVSLLDLVERSRELSDARSRDFVI